MSKALELEVLPDDGRAITVLRPYQMEGAMRIREMGGRVLLADSMGLGKTLQALYWCYKTKKARPIIVVCPASLKWNWEREAAHHLGMLSMVLEGRRPPKRGFGITPPALIILNYDILGSWLDFLRALNPQVVILDECHNIKNQESQRSIASRQLCVGVPHVIALSGTPITNRPAELWPTLNILFPARYDSFFAFALRYCKPRRMPWGKWSYTGAKNLDELHANLKNECMIRRLKKDVLKELPEKTRTVVPVKLEAGRMREYKEATTDFLGWLKRLSPERAKRAAKAEALVKVGYLMRLVARHKVPNIFEWIDNFEEESDGKLVIFSVNSPMIRALERRYHGRAVTVDGSVTGKARMQAVDEFHHEKDCRFLIGHYKSAGEGLNLTCASTVLRVDFPWTPGAMLQAEDRVHRMGQKNASMIYDMVAIDTIEEDICRLLEDKQAVLSQVLDGGTNEADDLSIATDLLNLMIMKAK